MSSEGKNSFILHLDSLEILDDMNDQETACLLRAMRDYNLGNEVKLIPTIKLVFKQFKNQFDRDAQKWEKTRERRAISGAKGGAKKALNTSKSDTKLANASNTKQKLANDTKSKQELANLAVNVNDNVNVNVNVNDNSADAVKSIKDYQMVPLPVAHKQLEEMVLWQEKIGMRLNTNFGYKLTPTDVKVALKTFFQHVANEVNPLRDSVRAYQVWFENWYPVHLKYKNRKNENTYQKPEREKEFIPYLKRWV